jgi:hypothetical protein
MTAVIVKLYFGDDLRRFPVDKEITYDALVVYTRQAFSIEAGHVQFAFKDEDGDMCRYHLNPSVPI